MANSLPTFALHALSNVQSKKHSKQIHTSEQGLFKISMLSCSNTRGLSSKVLTTPNLLSHESIIEKCLNQGILLFVINSIERLVMLERALVVERSV